MVRSIAEVCELDAVLEVLGAAPGFGLLHQGTLPFAGREGARLWTQLVETIADRWDEVIDALDELVATPEVDAAALAAAEQEERASPMSSTRSRRRSPRPTTTRGRGRRRGRRASGRASASTRSGSPPRTATVVTLRCYLDDAPVFLGSGGRIEVFGSERALARWIAEDGADGPRPGRRVDVVRGRGAGRGRASCEVEVDELNAYTLTGLDRRHRRGHPVRRPRRSWSWPSSCCWTSASGPATTRARQALAESQALGWLVSFVIKPDPTRLAPSPPFDAEAARFRELAEAVTARLQQHD